MLITATGTIQEEITKKVSSYVDQKKMVEKPNHNQQPYVVRESVNSKAMNGRGVYDDLVKLNSVESNN